MIGIEGQFILGLDIDNNKDFLDEDDLVKFTVYEYAGNILPLFNLVFKSTDEKIRNKLSEGTVIKVKYGRTIETLKEANLYPNNFASAKAGSEFFMYECNGFSSNISYITNQVVKTTGKLSAIEATIETAKKYFTVLSNITKSNDSMSWIQPNVSDKSFIADTYMRANLGTSFPAIAITADNKFILKDVLKALKVNKSNYDWKFTKTATGKNEISYDSDPAIKSHAGLINNWLCYGKSFYQTNIQSGESKQLYENPEVVLALSNELDKYKSIEKRYGGVRSISDSVSDTFWSSYNHNLMYLAMLSRISLTLSFSNDFRDIKPLDIAMFVEESNEKHSQASDHSSGLYLISGVIRTYEEKQMSTIAVLNREVLNNTKSN